MPLEGYGPSLVTDDVPVSTCDICREVN